MAATSYETTRRRKPPRVSRGADGNAVQHVSRAMIRKAAGLIPVLGDSMSSLLDIEMPRCYSFYVQLTGHSILCEDGTDYEFIRSPTGVVLRLYPRSGA